MTTKNQFEQEVTAMRTIFKALDKLDEDSRTRVLKYVTEAECDRHSQSETPINGVGYGALAGGTAAPYTPTSAG